jgi:hypothetical protein
MGGGGGGISKLFLRAILDKGPMKLSIPIG